LLYIVLKNITVIIYNYIHGSIVDDVVGNQPGKRQNPSLGIPLQGEDPFVLSTSVQSRVTTTADNKNSLICAVVMGKKIQFQRFCYSDHSTLYPPI